ncbi:hypothetical protein SJ05684_b47490 (plasmid) [Sinorhizobium sojae CCBAU 05684]|uniref:Uncharacterized protein n=1 Tax=Sinorhizobium sojae CCBAU 05684 TaxID=716928 RepID=A0A249PIJ9_9HYPH|nr:hypothetical protein [Sinorhizobium sojae]ASY65731.1 hypothetical protein SJ05684_b47490 [Sinorhizobium sojae CCBAU 05684]
MRPVRDDALAVLENAAIRLSALNAADASKAQPWLSELDENLARRLASTKRMRARIFGGLVSDAGDPADLSDPVRRLLSLTPEARRTTAIGAGLAYHIASLGPAMARETIEALAVIFGREVVSFALANSYLVAAAPLPSRQLGDQYPGIVEADGWAILRLLASGTGLDPYGRPAGERAAIADRLHCIVPRSRRSAPLFLRS